MEDIDPTVAAARDKLRERAVNRFGGKGTARRKKAVARDKVGTGSAVDGQKVQGLLKRLGLRSLGAMSEFDEVVFVKENDKCWSFQNPKIQIAPGANTYAVTGRYVEKNYEEASWDQQHEMLKQLVAQIQQHGTRKEDGTEGEDEVIPELTENFDEVADADDADESPEKDSDELDVD
eukprot:Trichotokara_eunicae@DN2893_c0_g1_i1.p1